MVKGGKASGGRGARRPPIRKVSASRIRRYVPRRPITVPRPEGIRYLRADGTPNWSQILKLPEGEVKQLASSPAITVSTSGNILEALEIMTEHKVRGLPVVSPGNNQLAGIVTALDLVNYLGGGEYYNIILHRYKGNIYNALRDEKITTIANPTPIFVSITDKIDDVVNTIINTGIGIIPVIWEDGSVYGVITEHDIVRYSADTPVGVNVGEVATRSIVTVNIEATLKDAAKTMVKHGFRRLPVLGENNEVIKGIITAKDIVYYFGSHEAFKHLESTNIEEALSTPVYELMTPEFYTVNEHVDVADAARYMMQYGTSSLLVVDDEDNIVGIITERDVLTAIVLSKSP